MSAVKALGEGMGLPRKVFVLGAGFTKAFLPGAPLVTDDYDVDSLMNKFAPFPHAQRLLALERQANPDGRINIERVMTRLDGGMPYDSDAAGDQLRLLHGELRRVFVERINGALMGAWYRQELGHFARYCVKTQTTCITFNYDDVLDRALWEVEKAERAGHPRPYWHPDGGYGFFCKPSPSCVYDTGVFMDRPVAPLLKLHGSMNWRPKRGARVPYALDAIVHHESWYPFHAREEINLEGVEAHLEAEPFIVPPILMKSVLLEQPVLRLVWSLAYDALKTAEEVAFVGYSLPLTDIAARFLFSEALQELEDTKILVVNYAQDNPTREEVVRSYRMIFPEIKLDQFSFDGALQWAKTLVSPE